MPVLQVMSGALSLWAHALVEPRDRLDVVAEHLRPRVEHGVEGLGRALEIGDEDLDRRARRLSADLADRRGEDLCAAVGELVAVHARHDGVPERHPRDRLAHARRLREVDRARASGLHRAEAAGPRACVPQDHERGRAGAPALGHVRAVRLLADRVQRFRAHEPAQLLDLRSHREPHLEPVGPLFVDRHPAVRRTTPARARTLYLARDFERDRYEFAHAEGENGVWPAGSLRWRGDIESDANDRAV